MKIQFTKMHGCGNDYVYVDCVAHKYDIPDKAALARYVSDRHFGIGSDGLIFINPSDKADFEMEMYNSDGSRAEMCGNGIRCVAKYVFDNGYTNMTPVFTIESMGKVKVINVFMEAGLAGRIKVDMGEPILKPSLVPCNFEGEQAVSESITVDGQEYKVTCVSMGNPHAVLFSGQTEAGTFDLDNFEIEKIGPKFENHEMFPRRTNTEFVHVTDRQNVEMRVWERGAGETLACGTGCCATCVACVLNDLTDNEITIKVLGGEIEVLWDQFDNHVYMTGPAETVFTGEIEYEF